MSKHKTFNPSILKKNMKKIICDKIVRVIKNKKKLEETLKIKVTNNGREVSIEGEPHDEYIAEKVIDALNLGFPFSVAISIKEEDKIFEILNIKDYTKRNLETVKGRIIGRSGRALKTLSHLTGCALEVKDHYVGIIGEAEEIERTINSLISIIQGAKHSAVYGGLEKSQLQPIYDYGLKNEKEAVTMEEYNRRLGVKNPKNKISEDDFEEDDEYEED